MYEKCRLPDDPLPLIKILKTVPIVGIITEKLKTLTEGECNVSTIINSLYFFFC